MPYDNCTDIVRGSLGRIWIGTMSGLNCFDGDNIEDDGIGIANSQARKAANKTAYKPRGMSFTRERLNLLAKAGKESVAVLVSDPFPASTERPGTRVEVVINI